MRYQCPACRQGRTELEALTVGGWTCPVCEGVWRSRNGLIEGLTSEQLARYEQFRREYLHVRQAEGRGSESPQYYLELPFRSGVGPVDWQWKLRAKTWKYFERRILRRLEEDAGRPLEVLDLGAGVGWLSYRLALRGHHPIAIDALDDPLDGLGAAKHYRRALERPFPAITAAFDNIPLADDQFDLAIFNASFHYAADYREVLREVRRVLVWGGRVVILDTPIYRSFHQGEMMVEERRRAFERRYGFASDSLLSMEYLDEGMIASLGRELGITWSADTPWYGLAWALRPWRAKLTGQRPPSRFRILTGSWTSVS